MTKYRIIYQPHDARPDYCYVIQRKDWFFWEYILDATGRLVHYKSYESAKSKIDSLIR